MVAFAAYLAIHRGEIRFVKSTPITDLRAPLAVSRRDLLNGTGEGVGSTSRFIDSTVIRLEAGPPSVAFRLENPPSWWREKLGEFR